MNKIGIYFFSFLMVFFLFSCNLGTRDFHNGKGDNNGQNVPYHPLNPPIPPKPILSLVSKSMVLKPGSTSGSYTFPTHMLLIQPDKKYNFYSQVILGLQDKNFQGYALSENISIGKGNGSFSFIDPILNKTVSVVAPGIANIASLKEAEGTLNIQVNQIDSQGKTQSLGSATYTVKGTESTTLVPNSKILPGSLVSKNILLNFTPANAQFTYPNQILLVDNVKGTHQYNAAIVANVDKAGNGYTNAITIKVNNDNEFIFTDPKTQYSISISGTDIAKPNSNTSWNTSQITISITDQSGKAIGSETMDVKTQSTVDTKIHPRNQPPIQYFSKMLYISNSDKADFTLPSQMLLIQKNNSGFYTDVVLAEQDDTGKGSTTTVPIILAPDHNSFTYNDPQTNNVVSISSIGIGNPVTTYKEISQGTLISTEKDPKNQVLLGKVNTQMKSEGLDVSSFTPSSTHYFAYTPKRISLTPLSSNGVLTDFPKFDSLLLAVDTAASQTKAYNFFALENKNNNSYTVNQGGGFTFNTQQDTFSFGNIFSDTTGPNSENTITVTIPDLGAKTYPGENKVGLATIVEKDSTGHVLSTLQYVAHIQGVVITYSPQILTSSQMKAIKNQNQAFRAMQSTQSSLVQNNQGSSAQQIYFKSSGHYTIFNKSNLNDPYQQKDWTIKWILFMGRSLSNALTLTLNGTDAPSPSLGYAQLVLFPVFFQGYDLSAGTQAKSPRCAIIDKKGDDSLNIPVSIGTEPGHRFSLIFNPKDLGTMLTFYTSEWFFIKITSDPGTTMDLYF